MKTLNRLIAIIFTLSFVASSFSSSAKAFPGVPVANAQTCNNLDVVWVLDLTNTMGLSFDGTTKLAAIKSKITAVNTAATLGANSRAAFITFMAGGSALKQNYTNNFTALNNMINGQTASPQEIRQLSNAFIKLKDTLSQRSPKTNRSVVVFITDSSPNRDEYGSDFRHYPDISNVANVNLYTDSTNTTFRGIPDVRGSGVREGGIPSGQPLGQAMTRVQDILALGANGLGTNGTLNAIALDGQGSQINVSNSMQDYFAKAGGNPGNTGNAGKSFRVTTQADLQTNLSSILNCGGGGGGSLTCSYSPTSPNVGDQVTFNAGGGTIPYNWGGDTGTDPSGTGQSFTTHYSSTGSKHVTVDKPGFTQGFCDVTINSGGGGGGSLTCSYSPQQPKVAVSQPVTFTVSGGSAPYTWGPSGNTGTNTNPGTGNSFTTTFTANNGQSDVSYTITVNKTGFTQGTCTVIVSPSALIIDLPPAWNFTGSQIADRLFYPRQLYLATDDELHTSGNCSGTIGAINSTATAFTFSSNPCGVTASVVQKTTDSTGQQLDYHEYYYEITITGDALLNINPDLTTSRSWQQRLAEALGLTIGADKAQAYAPPPAGNILLLAPKPVTCSPSPVTVNTGTPITFTAGGGNGIFSWTVIGGGGASPSSGNGPTFTTTFTTAGNNISVKATSAGISSMCQVTVNSGGSLSCSITPSTAAINQDVTVTASNGSGNYVWSGDLGSNTTPGNVATFTTHYTTERANPYVITITRGSVSANCQVVIKNFTCTISPNPATPSTTDNVTVNATPGYSPYSWSGELGSNTTPGNVVSFTTHYTNTRANPYVITVTSGTLISNCSVTITSSSQFTCDPAVSFVKKGINVTLTATPGFSPYSWSTTGNGTFSGNLTSNVVAVKYTLVSPMDTPYLVTVTGTNSAPAQATCKVNVRSAIKKTVNYRLSFLSGSVYDAFKYSTLTDVKTYIAGAGHAGHVIDNMKLYQDQSCVTGSNLNDPSTFNYICFYTTVRYIVGGKTFDTAQQLVVTQSVPIIPIGGGGNNGTITIEGNVAGGNDLKDFTFEPNSHSLVVGGTIDANVTAGTSATRLNNYLRTSTLKWLEVGPKILPFYNKRTEGEQFISTGSYTETAWRLNSNTSSPAAITSSTQSTPPEGKLWRVVADANNTPTNLVIANNITFSGSGTLVVDGTVTFNGTVSCLAGTRLGIIANGSITFNKPEIGCGAYLAFAPGVGIRGDITISLSPIIAGVKEAKGIFIAKDDIKLPVVNTGAAYRIKYDNTFAANPPVLFRDFLEAIFKSGS